MVPGAEAIDLVAPDGSAVLLSMDKRHPAGFFTATVTSGERPWYRLHVLRPHGWELGYDPYAYQAILTDAEVARIREVGSDSHYRVLGAHRKVLDGIEGYLFAVWAPNARQVSLVGEFNDWDGRGHPMRLRHDGGVWELFMPGLVPAVALQVRDQGRRRPAPAAQADPVAFAAEQPPATASIVQGPAGPRTGPTRPGWKGAPRATRAKAPISIYECHLGSWARVPEDGDRYLTYRELAERLIPYVGIWASRISSCCRSPSFPSTARGATSRCRCSRRRAASASPEDFAFFVEAAHAAGHRPHPRLGAGPLSRTTRTGSASSTARISTSMPIRARAFTRIGAPTSTITGARRWRPSWSPMRASGSSTTTSTACASMRSRRCSTSTTRASMANGCRTATAATRTSRPSTSCGA